MSVARSPSLRSFGHLTLGVIACAVLAACGGGGGSAEADAVGYFVPKAGDKANLSGAIFTSLAGCTSSNQNAFTSRQDVYLSGGPVKPGSAGLLPDSNYYVKVTDPSGVLLGATPGADVPSDADGKLACVSLWQILKTPSNAQGYEDSPNGGGVYKVWVSLSPNFEGAVTKTDNFRIGAAVAPSPVAELTVQKWYDANANGRWDGDELAMEGDQPNTGWKVTLLGYASKFTSALYTGLADSLGLGWSTAAELRPAEGSSDWRATNAYREGAFAFASTLDASVDYLAQFNVELTTGTPTATVNFGNLCLGPGNGHTPGFWSNKNGAKAIVDSGLDVYAALNALNLVDAAGNPVVLTDHASLNAFLLGGTATNMANMLSVHMAAMWLNANAGGVNGAGMVYGRLADQPDPDWLNEVGYVSVNGLIAAANASLGSNPYTRSGNERSKQERIKNLLDSLNNNDQLYVQPRSACVVAF